MSSDDSTFKLAFGGNQGVGKSTILCRFAEGTFQENIPEFEMKRRDVNVDGKEIGVAMFDTAGQERFRTLTAGYYANTAAAVIVFDVTDPESYEAVPNWVNDVRRYVKNATVMILANKTDLDDKKVDMDEVRSYADNNKFLFYPVSAKDGTNIDEAFNSLLKAVIASRKKEEEDDDEQPQKPEKSSGCCTIM